MDTVMTTKPFGKRQPCPKKVWYEKAPPAKPLPTYAELLGTTPETEREKIDFIHWYVNPLNLSPMQYIVGSVLTVVFILLLTGVSINQANNEFLSASDRTCEVVYSNLDDRRACQQQHRYIFTGKRY